MGLFSYKRDKKLMEQQNAFNEAMMEKQQGYNVENFEREAAWNEMMYDKSIQNQWDVAQYNSPVEARKRYAEAGINPYTALEGITGSNSATASASSPSSPRANSPQMAQGVTPPYGNSILGDITNVLQGVGDVVSQLTGVSNGVQDYRGKKIDNDYKALNLTEDLKGKVLDNKGKELGNYYQGVLNDFIRQEKEVAYQQSWQDVFTKRLYNRGLELDNIAKDLNLQALPAQIKMSLTNQLLDIRNSYLQGNLTKAQAKKAANEAILISEQAAGVRIDNEIKRDTKDYVVQSARYDAAIKRWTGIKTMNNSGPSDPTGIANFLYQNQINSESPFYYPLQDMGTDFYESLRKKGNQEWNQVKKGARDYWKPYRKGWDQIFFSIKQPFTY